MIIEVMIALIIISLLFSVASFVFRKPGPKGDKGRDGFICDDLTREHIITLLNECDEIILPNTTIVTKNIHRKTKKS